MGTSQGHTVPTFHQACMADVSVSYKVLKFENPQMFGYQ